MVKENPKPVRSSIVPGRKMITKYVALHEGGMSENMSYLANKTVMEDSLDCTQDKEEREWKRQGLSEEQIFRNLENRKLKKINNAEHRLMREKYGAKNFLELLDRPEYSELESGNEEPSIAESKARDVVVFAIPALPKHLSEKSMFGSPIAGSKGSGKAGLSCSTPKSSNDESMHSLKALDFSHVIAVDTLEANKVTVHQKDIQIPMKDQANASSVEKTFIINVDHGIPETSSNSETVTVQKDRTSDVANEEDESPCQKTFTVENESKNSSLQKTFTVAPGWKNSFLDSDCEHQKDGISEPVDSTENVEEAGSSDKTRMDDSIMIARISTRSEITENDLQGGLKKNTSKLMGPQASKKRDANSTLMSSMIEDFPSPGAGLFKNTRKKMRPTNATQRKAINRLSNESDKERTIEMLSIVEEPSVHNDSIGPSFVDPCSERLVNTSQVSPVQEKDEQIESSIVDTPKSTKRAVDQSSSMERARARSILSTPNPTILDNSILITPKHNYQKPTISSIVKSKNIDTALFEATKKDCRTRTPGRIDALLEVVEEHTLTDDLEQGNHQDKKGRKNDKSGEDKIEFVPIADKTNSDLNEIRPEMDVSSVREQLEDFDFAADDRIERFGNEKVYDVNEFQEYHGEHERRHKTTTRRVALMSDSVAIENSLLTRPNRRHVANDSTTEEGWQSDEEPVRYNRGRNNKEIGLQLKKREIIQPATPTNEVRRSTRTRVKPVRSWLGEKPVYVNSPSGGKRLTGVTDVIINDKRQCKYRTADPRTATEREQKERAIKKKAAADRRRQLALDQSRGNRMNESQDDIHTDDEE